MMTRRHSLFHLFIIASFISNYYVGDGGHRRHRQQGRSRRLPQLYSYGMLCRVQRQPQVPGVGKTARQCRRLLACWRLSQRHCAITYARDWLLNQFNRPLAATTFIIVGCFNCCGVVVARNQRRSAKHSKRLYTQNNIDAWKWDHRRVAAVGQYFEEGATTTFKASGYSAFTSVVLDRQRCLLLPVRMCAPGERGSSFMYVYRQCDLHSEGRLLC